MPHFLGQCYQLECFHLQESGKPTQWLKHTPVFPVTRRLGRGWYQCWLIQQLRARVHFLFLPFHWLVPMASGSLFNFRYHRETPEYPTEEEGLFFPRVSPFIMDIWARGKEIKTWVDWFASFTSWFETVAVACWGNVQARSESGLFGALLPPWLLVMGCFLVLKHLC